MRSYSGGSSSRRRNQSTEPAAPTGSPTSQRTERGWAAAGPRHL